MRIVQKIYYSEITPGIGYFNHIKNRFMFYIILLKFRNNLDDNFSYDDHIDSS